MENIKFNFNHGGIKHPNGGEFDWIPENHLNKYNYKMNWFAWIITECNNVIIDLDWHTSEVDRVYLQNRQINDITFND